jgi:hypothetical protein
MKYYRLLDDLGIRERWFLVEIAAVDGIKIWDYRTAGKRVIDLSPELTVEISEKVTPLNITFSAFDVLVGDEKAGTLFSEEEVQQIPLTVNGMEDQSYYVLVPLLGVDCIDREKSVFTLWERDNDIRPDLAGTYEQISKIVVDCSKMRDMDIVRISGFDNAIIISERLKGKLTTTRISGVSFEAV